MRGIVSYTYNRCKWKWTGLQRSCSRLSAFPLPAAFAGGLALPCPFPGPWSGA